VTLTSFASAGAPVLGSQPDHYQPGVCNIGPDEIARRRRSGHIGAIATVITLAVLIALDAPPFARFLVAIPAAGAAAGYLQAFFKFCIAFGSVGVFNFGRRGTIEHVADPAARARDRMRVVQLSLAVALIAVAIGLLAVLIPLP
jgi:hypothetical protein